MLELSHAPAATAATTAAARWRAHVAAHARSGQSVRAYCEAHGLKTPTFYDRRRRLAARPAFVSVDVAPPPARAAAAVAVDGDAGVEVVLPGGVRVRLGRGFDADVLRAAVAALSAEVRPC